MMLLNILSGLNQSRARISEEQAKTMQCLYECNTNLTIMLRWVVVWFAFSHLVMNTISLSTSSYTEVTGTC